MPPTSPVSRLRNRSAARSLSVAAVSAVVGAAALAACSGGGKSVNVGGNASKPPGTQLTAAIAGEPDQLDPQKTTSYFSFEVLENVFDTLVEPDASLKMQPALASSWTTSANQLSWTFKLRSGVKFSNGDTFSSADVVYSYDRIINQKLSNSYRFATVKSVTAVDPSTVRIDLKSPTPNLLADIGSFKGMAIVDKKNVESGKIGSQPVGTGPFSFDSYQRGTSIVLKRNPNYWGGAPKLGSVKFIFVPEPSTALADLQSGEVQWTDNLPPAQVAGLEKGGNPVVKSTPSNDYWYVALNEARKPFNDKRVRQAIAYAIDRNAIMQAARFGNAQVNETAIPKTSPWYYDYSPYQTNVAKAKSLLAQAGVKNLSLDFMVTSEYPETVQAAQVMQAELAKVGINLKIRTEDFATWLDDESAGKYDGFMLGWLGNVDPDDFYYAQQHTGGADNFQKYSNTAVDSELDKGHTSADENVRRQAYDMAAKMIVDDASYIYLYNPDTVQGFTSRLTGYQVRADKAIRFRDASLSG